MFDQKSNQGLADQKKADLDYLTAQVNKAKYQVVEQQAIVTALQTKLAQFNMLLQQADRNKTTALTNRNLVNDAMASVKSLNTNAQFAAKQTDIAANGIKDKKTNKTIGGISNVAREMALLIDKLIFSAEIIDKVTQFVNKQKAANQLIPDSLITHLTSATKNANNAVALTLTALQSCYASEATLLESKGVMEQAATQAIELDEKNE